MKVTPRAVISSTLVRPVCGGGKLVRSEVGSEIIISQHLAAFCRELALQSCDGLIIIILVMPYSVNVFYVIFSCMDKVSLLIPSIPKKSSLATINYFISN